MPVNGAAKKVDAKNVSPAWKVLQMKLNEAKADKERLEAEKAKEAKERGDEPVEKVLSKKALRRKRQREAERTEKAEKEVAKKRKLMELKRKFLCGRNTGDLTALLALDCEYVGLGDDGRKDSLARVSIVNEEGDIVYDKFVEPTGKVTDYRTHVSGIRPEDLVNALKFEDVQVEVKKLLMDRTVVGHGLSNDFRVMGFDHPRHLIRDSVNMMCLRRLAGLPLEYKPKLKYLAEKLLVMEIQGGEHDSVVDARVALRLYQLHKKVWEREVKGRRNNTNVRNCY